MFRRPAVVIAITLVLAVSACSVAAEPTPRATPAVAFVPTAVSGTLIDQAIPAAEQYLAAMQSYDAQGMWDAYSTAGQESLTGQGGSVAVLQKRLDEWKSQNFRIDRYVRIGTYLLPDGGAFTFYVAIGVADDASRSGEVYYVFTVNRDGKIDRVQ